MKNSLVASKELQSLFVELININLNNYKKITQNMLENNIQYFAELAGFNLFPIEYWYLICDANNIKFNA